ncbi:SusD/RagB family nutrient-binding outer membrane lipoprotein [Rhizosphaericola mali]|uniref:SusD/RagB family nutrient-binding outer membrane lipoprotein n=1 Tax=Rhizosphaericola mali TaxID=2545455 RepID=A0A5P2GC41_9BACT|nr:SusD/RagB family nutrient-binding outer membrane lipoprotein [Rhizosphaericola mali]QES89131.1 SusD/RagB family nutrient-binding outer membrane lipoprotein [Rhizosphaericola mali]
MYRNKIIKVLTALLCIPIIFTSCKKFLNVNKDNNDLTSPSVNLLLGPIEESVSSRMAAGGAAIYINYWMQNMTLNQPVPNEVTYVVYNSSFNSYWYYAYVTNLNNMKIMDSLAMVDGNDIYAGIAKTLTAYTLGDVTDWWGDVPYSAGLSGVGNLTPKFDSQESIYTNLQVLLDSAIIELDRGNGLVPSTDDYFYSGNATSWKKLAYSLKARFYMHLINASGYDVQTQSKLALAALDNGLTSYTEDCYFTYNGGQNYSSPWYWNFYNTSTNILASNYVDSLKSRKDPRLTKLVAPAANTGLYTGSVIGSGFQTLYNFSIPGDFYAADNANGYIFSADEALFLKAEATYYVSGLSAAQEVYQTAILNNMAKMGLSASADSVQAYLTNRGTLTTSNAIQRIMEEKSVANFFSPEIWTDWRRTGYPALTVISTANGAPANTKGIPRRFLYPLSEETANASNVPTATLTDRVWWDTK